MSKRSELIGQLDRKLQASIKTVDKLLAGSIVSAGLKAGDSYHKGDLSILKTSQLLWAMSEASTHARTDKDRKQLRQFLLAAVCKPEYAEYWERVFNLVFALLALTSEAQDVSSKAYEDLVRKLLFLRKSSGEWGFYEQGRSSVRATSLACYALARVLRHTGTDSSPYSEIPDAIRVARRWLFDSVSPGGTWGRTTQFSSDVYCEGRFEPGIENTSWAICAICESLQAEQKPGLNVQDRDLLTKGMSWLLSLRPELIATQIEIEQEQYKIGSEKYHDYETLGLEMAIVAALSYRNCARQRLVPGLEIGDTLVKWTQRLLANERDGFWYCKNCGDYRHLWTIAHAIYSLASMRAYLVEQGSAFEIAKAQLVAATRSAVGRVIHSRLLSALAITAALSVASACLGFVLPKTLFSTYQNHIAAFGVVLTIVGTYLALKKP